MSKQKSLSLFRTLLALTANQNGHINLPGFRRFPLQNADGGDGGGGAGGAGGDGLGRNQLGDFTVLMGELTGDDGVIGELAGAERGKLQSRRAEKTDSKNKEGDQHFNQRDAMLRVGGGAAWGRKGHGDFSVRKMVLVSG